MDVVTETSRASPDTRVIAWLGEHGDRLWLPAIVLADIRYAVDATPPSRERYALKRWLAALTARFAARIVPFDAGAAEAHARLRVHLAGIGETMDAADSYIAATATSRNAPIATSERPRFAHAQVAIVDPR